ncbi:ABC transporter ATP-binding protein [Candidatus Latescibacterota bacterium]
MPIIIKDLTKRYPGDITALDGINLEIEGGMFGLVGPNGAGKTTLMRILTTLMEPTSGSVTVNEMDIFHNRANIRAMTGYLPQSFSRFPKLRTHETLRYSAELAGVNNHGKVDEMLDLVGLLDARERYANKLSGGMKRRLGIAQALIGDPKIVIVDEPTTGLDPEERLKFRNLLVEIATEDRTVILSTHILGDITSSCNAMAVLEKGKLAFSGSPNDLIEKAKGLAWEITVPESEFEQTQSEYKVISSVPHDGEWKVQIVGERPDKHNPVSIEPSLEHAYMHFFSDELSESVTI